MVSHINIAPSLLSADFSQLGQEIQALEKAQADWFHFDIMDGHFVPNITFGPDVVACLRPLTSKVFDVHLMICPVDPYLQAFAKAGADIITVHAEATHHLDRTLSSIQAMGKKAGLCFNPSTPLDCLEYVIDKVDLILIMTVNPGFGGQKFLPSQLRKIRQAREYISKANRPIDLSVDGGITAHIAPAVKEAGANILVAGSAAFKGGQPSYGSNIQGLRG